MEFNGRVSGASGFDAGRIRVFRKEALGLSQEQFAYALGVSVKTLWRWENETSKPSSLARKQLEAFELNGMAFSSFLNGGRGV